VIDPTWWALLIGVVITVGGTAMILFRVEVAKFFARIPTGHPNTPETAFLTGAVFAVGGLVFVWGAASHLMSLG
jgi:hypothetical protein